MDTHAHEQNIQSDAHELQHINSHLPTENMGHNNTSQVKLSVKRSLNTVFMSKVYVRPAHQFDQMHCINCNSAATLFHYGRA